MPGSIPLQATPFLKIAFPAMSPALTFFRRAPAPDSLRMVFCHRSSGPQTLAWLGLSVLLVAFCLEAAFHLRKRSAGTRPSGRHFIPDQPNAAGRSANHLRPARPGGRGDPKACGRLRRERTCDHAPGRDRILVQIPGLDTQQIETTKANATRRQARVRHGGRRRGTYRTHRSRRRNHASRLRDQSLQGSDRGQRGGVQAPRQAAGRALRRARQARLRLFRPARIWRLPLARCGRGEDLRRPDPISGSHPRSACHPARRGMQSAPHVNEPIYGGSAVITGRFTDKEARDLASALENPLRVPVEVEETRSVSATLGTDSIRSGVLAGLDRSGVRVRFRHGLLPHGGRGGIHRPAGKHRHPLRSDGDVQLRAHAAGHRRHHPHASAWPWMRTCSSTNASARKRPPANP